MKKYAKESWVGLFMTIGLLCIIYLAFRLGDVSIFGSDSYPLQARFTNVGSLREGNPVTMMGIDIGRVTGVHIDQERHQAVVDFRVEKTIDIYEDAIASIRTQGLIGQQYMAIDPGGLGEPLKAGDTIVDTEAPVNINELISKYAFGSVNNKEDNTEIK